MKDYKFLAIIMFIIIGIFTALSFVEDNYAVDVETVQDNSTDTIHENTTVQKNSTDENKTFEAILDVKNQQDDILTELQKLSKKYDLVNRKLDYMLDGDENNTLIKKNHELDYMVDVLLERYKQLNEEFKDLEQKYNEVIEENDIYKALVKKLLGQNRKLGKLLAKNGMKV